MKEIWKNIKGYNREYKISNFGKVLSLKNGKKLLKYSTTQNYAKVMLCKNNKSKSFNVHRLVLIAFTPNPENKPCCNHKDGNKLNNEINNLEWCTYSENNKHAYQTGLMDRSGEKNASAKLNRFQVKRIRLMKEINPKLTQRKIAKIFNVHFSTINLILHYKKWQHL